MKTGFFDRVTLCSSCGAPLDIGAGGESVRCGKCGEQNQVVARIDDAVSEGWSADEFARLDHLRTQSSAYAPDPALAPFMAGMRLGLHAGTEAFAQWQALRSRVSPGDVAAERLLTELAWLLAQRAADDGDPYRERGLLESSLTLVRTPRATQILRAGLGALAARMGDPAGGEAWLGLCEPRSADLRTDSYYRYARALVDTAKGELGAVLTVLGGNDVEVPVVDELGGACALLRANAWERLGRLGAAVDLLSHYKFESDAFGQQLARSFMSASSRLDLCPRAEPEAERRRQRALGRRRIPWTKGMLVIFAISVHWALGGVLLIAEGLWSLYSSDGVSFGLSISFSFIMFFAAAILLSLFWKALRRTQGERALLARGEIAPGRVQSASIVTESPAGVAFAARLWICPDRAPPFEVETTIGSSPERFAELRAGKPFTVRYLGRDILFEPVLR